MASFRCNAILIFLCILFCRFRTQFLVYHWNSIKPRITYRDGIEMNMTQSWHHSLVHIYQELHVSPQFLIDLWETRYTLSLKKHASHVRFSVENFSPPHIAALASSGDFIFSDFDVPDWVYKSMHCVTTFDVCARQFFMFSRAGLLCSYLRLNSTFFILYTNSRSSPVQCACRRSFL